MSHKTRQNPYFFFKTKSFAGRFTLYGKFFQHIFLDSLKNVPFFVELMQKVTCPTGHGKAPISIPMVLCHSRVEFKSLNFNLVSSSDTDRGKVNGE